MKNFARFGLGSDTTMSTIVGYAMCTTGRIGPVTLQFENHGDAPNGPGYLATVNDPTAVANIQVCEFVPGVVVDGIKTGTWSVVVQPFTIAPGGRVSVNMTTVANKIGIFGYGNTMVSLEIPTPHAAALRGGHIDIEPVGRQGFGFDPGVDRNEVFPPMPN